MLCLVQLSAYRVGCDYDVAEWLKLNGVSYYCMNQPVNEVWIPSNATALIVSGAPLHSRESTHLAKLISTLSIPVFGICFGCMAVVTAFGGTFADANREPSEIEVVGTLPGHRSFTKATAAHREMIVDTGELVACLWDSNDEIVGVQHPTKPVFGVLFHPESPATESGTDILKAFLKWPAT